MNIRYTPDPIADFNEWDYEQEKWLRSRPLCDICDEHIQGEGMYIINDLKICTDCMKQSFTYIED